MSMSLAMRCKLAARNVMKNRRRSLVTVLSVAIGFLALSLFEGYFTYVYRILKDQAIVGERLGHLTVVRRGFFDQGTLDPEKFQLDAAALDLVTRTVREVPGVKLVSPRLAVSGLVSNGTTSHIFIGEAISAEDQTALRGAEYAYLPGKLAPGQDDAVVIGQKMAKIMGLQQGSDGVLMASTLSGMVNAVDFRVGEIANTGSMGTDDKFALLPLALARKLYGSDGADRVVVLLDSVDSIPAVKPVLLQKLKAAGFDADIKEWSELSVYYTQVKGLFDMMYLFIMVVVVMVAMTSVVNTMTMAIAERTREIGTLRAIGMRSMTIKSLFVIEGVIIVFVGSLAGMALSYAIGAGINLAQITYSPPDSSEQAALVIELLFNNMFGSLFTLSVLAAVASYFPARHATQKTIVGALGHV
ncbi:ABC transporter permease [Methylomonas sp. HW2-6]|uniref:ABC transporter permease n=1 Tax=Methylomonas sp. HW2-6 TaxID=3376687 RepID=UPI0040418663